MDCRRAQAQLKNLALSGEFAEAHARLAGELGEHVAACVACRAAFGRARAFVAAMNHALSASVAETPGPEALAQARRAVAKGVPERNWRWAQVAAASALAMAVVVIAWHYRRPVPPRVELPDTSAGSALVASALPAAPSRAHPEVRTTPLDRHSQRTEPRRERADALVAWIAPSQREASARLVSEIRRGNMDVASLAVESGPPVVTALDVAPLIVPPLDLSTDAAAAGNAQ
jgi:hypothetical protein